MVISVISCISNITMYGLIGYRFLPRLYLRIRSGLLAWDLTPFQNERKCPCPALGAVEYSGKFPLSHFGYCASQAPAHIRVPIIFRFLSFYRPQVSPVIRDEVLLNSRTIFFERLRKAQTDF